MSSELAFEPFLVSNDALNSPAELRARMERDGYLFFKRLLSPQGIAAARSEILALCENAGWLLEGYERDAAIAAPDVKLVEPEPDFMLLYVELLKGEAFNTLALDRNLLQTLSDLFGETPLAHSRNIARIIFPNNALYTTPSHQDYIHIQGTMETYTAWIPLGDCPTSLGSLVVMRGSHRSGVFPVLSAYGAGGVGIQTSELPFPWVGGDFENGDVIIFHSLTVHKAIPNEDPAKMRLSVDFRYQPLSHPIDPSSLEPHYSRQTWDEIYANWKSAENQYYWRKLPVRYAERDAQVAEIRAAAANTSKEDFAE